MESSATKLSIIIPTRNRSIQLSNAVKSARLIFHDIPIIIGDNSDIQNDLTQNKLIALKYNCQYLNLIDYAGDVLAIWLKLLENANTKYIYILEDDDIMTNANLHFLALKMMEKYNCFISFNIITNFSNKLLYSNKLIKLTDINSIPLFWNGQFQTGAAYYNKYQLLQAIHIWRNSSNVFNFSNDECLALLCIKQSMNYVHLPFVGLIVNKALSESVSKEWSIFSCRSYIDQISMILNINNITKEKWKNIQLKELSELCGINIAYNDVYNNNKLYNIEQFIINKLKTHSALTVKKMATPLLSQIFNFSNCDNQ